MPASATAVGVSFALNSYRKLRGAGRAGCVGDRVTEDISQRLAGRAQSLNGQLSVSTT